MGLADVFNKETTIQLRVPEFVDFVVKSANCGAERRVLVNAMQNNIPYEHALIMAGISVPSKKESEKEEEE